MEGGQGNRKQDGGTTSRRARVEGRGRPPSFAVSVTSTSILDRFRSNNTRFIGTGIGPKLLNLRNNPISLKFLRLPRLRYSSLMEKPLRSITHSSATSSDPSMRPSLIMNPTNSETSPHTSRSRFIHSASVQWSLICDQFIVLEENVQMARRCSGEPQGEISWTWEVVSPIQYLFIVTYRLTLQCFSGRKRSVGRSTQHRLAQEQGCPPFYIRAKPGTEIRRNHVRTAWVWDIVPHPDLQYDSWGSFSCVHEDENHDTVVVNDYLPGMLVNFNTAFSIDDLTPQLASVEEPHDTVHLDVGSNGHMVSLLPLFF